MTAAMYEYKGLQLIPFTKDDMSPKYQSWFHDPEVTKYNSHGLFPYTKERMREFADSLGGTDKIVWMMIANEGEVNCGHIGNVSLQSIDWINRSAEFAILIGDKNFFGKGWGTKAGELALYLGFYRLNLHRIWTGTAVENAAMRKLAGRLGMAAEGIFRDGVYLRGKYQSVISYGILRDEFNTTYSGLRWREQRGE